MPYDREEVQPETYRAHHISLGEGYAALSTERGYIQFAIGNSRHYFRCASREVQVEGLDLLPEEA